jgi:hypothetical protein
MLLEQKFMDAVSILLKLPFSSLPVVIRNDIIESYAASEILNVLLAFL